MDLIRIRMWGFWQRKLLLHQLSLCEKCSNQVHTNFTCLLQQHPHSTILKCWNPPTKLTRLICTNFWLMLKMDELQPRQLKCTDDLSLWLQQLQISPLAYTVWRTASLCKTDIIFLQEANRLVDQYWWLIDYLVIPFLVHQNSPPNEILK